MKERKPNRQLVAQAGDDVYIIDGTPFILDGTDFLYEGPEGVVLTSSFETSIYYWENGTGADCYKIDTNPDYPVLFYLPFTDDPDFNRQSIVEWNNGRLDDDFDFDDENEPDRDVFMKLQSAAIESGAHVSIALLQSGLLSGEFPDESWEQPEFMDHALEYWPQSLNYMPERLITPELFMKGMERSREVWGMREGVQEIIQASPERFTNLLSQDQWQKAEQEIPGILAIINSYQEREKLSPINTPRKPQGPSLG